MIRYRRTCPKCPRGPGKVCADSASIGNPFNDSLISVTLKFFKLWFIDKYMLNKS